MKFKILELNIGNPSLERAVRQCGWMQMNDYDIYVLTETRNSNGCNYISNYMESVGYQVIFPKPNGNNLGVMILSRIHLGEIDFLLDGKDELYGRFIRCRIMADFQHLDLIGIYVPSRDRSERKIARKERFCNITLSALKKNNDNLILCGDYNVLGIRHVPHYSVYFRWEYMFLQEIEDMELLDVFERLHPKIQEYSWKGRTGNGYRYDYIHISCRMIEQVRECRYVHETREAGKKITDHSGIMVEISTECR